MANEIIHAEVISLPDAAERREMVKSQLSLFPSLAWEFIDAVDGRKLASDPIEYNRRRAERLMGWMLNDGEIGCFLSHRRAWQKCLSKNKIVLVLEDDFLIKPNLPAAIDFAAENISAWDMLRLQAIHEHGNKMIIRQSGDFDIVQNKQDPFGSTAYLIKPESANILLKHSRRFYEPVDNYLENYEMHGLRMCAVKPYPIELVNFDSTINDRVPRASVRGFRQYKRSFFRIINRLVTGQRKP